ncbi:Tetratricopeptide repeat-containing protein [Rheinheimera pacifica]|uniref:Tetratricopeptide repeat-containing protein n=1 Tax=Rheinheimera pacifica TaxID=173990 RepID=A0A1H6N8K3_9GAMM|nr:tetratricopeptide repeat protein [Rheinheimera pacifica]SEI06750.1 Tetratricopeptide repeat-containing protein [Rheinheimera pacifica]
MPLIKPALVKYFLAAALCSLAACSQLPVSNAPAVPVVAAVQLNALQQQQFTEGKALLIAGQYSAAQNIFSALATQQSSFAGIWYNLALSQWHSGDAASAQSSLQQAVHASAAHSASHNLLGILARQQGNFRQAERHFQRALQAQPDYALAHKNLAFLYELYLGQPLAAHYHYQQYYAMTQDEQAKAWLALLEQQLDQEAANE